ncbi:MAG: hypothetical protein RIR18_1093 [Pseudomonadota bacterium]|jgi:hypothetical protein
MKRSRFFIPGSPQPSSWFGRVIQAILLTAVLVLTLMFSVVIIPTVIFLGLMAWAYIWWKTRALREQLKAAAKEAQTSTANAPPAEENLSADSQGIIIEGESIRVEPRSERF